MDRVTLVEKEISFNTRFAAPSILTGYFVAAVVGASEGKIRKAFTDPGDILVEDMNGLVAPVTYTGYKTIVEIREGANDITVILSKEENEE